MSGSRWHFSYIAPVIVLVATSVLGASQLEGERAYLQGDYARALEIWSPLAKQGDAEAQFGLGVMYERSQGVGRDYPRAARLYRRAADQGFAAAQFNLGSAYEAGRGLSRDRSSAALWWRRAADQGFARAQYNLGTLYYYGWGVEKDRGRAMEWFRRAAKQGDPGAQQVLATFNDVIAPTSAPPPGQREKPVPAAVAPTSRSPGVATARPPATIVPSAQVPALQGEAWLRRQKGDAYTLQLFANWTRQSIERFVLEHALAGDLAIYETRHEGRPWFALVYGIYGDAGAARQALAALSPQLRVMGAWARPFSEIHQILDGGSIVAKGVPDVGAVAFSPATTRGTEPTLSPRPSSGSTAAAATGVKRTKEAARPATKSVRATPPPPVAGVGEAARKRDEAWILEQNHQHFTVQIFGDDNLASVQRFKKKSGLAHQLAYFKFSREGHAWFSVIYGNFSEIAAARRAMEALPTALRRRSPWVRRFGAIHRLIGNRGQKPATPTLPSTAPPPSTAPQRQGTTLQRQGMTIQRQGMTKRGNATLARGQALFNRGRYEAAFALWRPLAIDGAREAQYSLGFMYESGWGVERDDRAARRWYALAAGQGHVRAQFNLGLMQVLGREVDRDVAGGLRWIREAAEADHAPARSFLAAAYRGGQHGLKQSTELAAFWSQDALRN